MKSLNFYMDQKHLTQAHFKNMKVIKAIQMVRHFSS